MLILIEPFHLNLTINLDIYLVDLGKAKIVIYRRKFEITNNLSFLVRIVGIFCLILSKDTTFICNKMGG